LQNCQPEPPPLGEQHWKADPPPDMHDAPGASRHAPQLHELVHTSTPHAVAVPAELRSHPVRVEPGEHAPWPEHVPHALHAPQVHPAVHVRVRVCIPQLPHVPVSLSTWPGVHSPPPPLHVPKLPHAPHEQSG
jgi:hypothetical protein